MSDWQKQNFKKSGSTGPTSMNSKIAGASMNLHAKISRSPVRKFADGGEVTAQDDATGVDEAIAKQAASQADTPTKEMASDDVRAAMGDSSADEAPAKKLSFKEAFAAGRASGDKTFEWNGKSYTTELAKSPAKPAASSAPKSEPAPSTNSPMRTKSVVIKPEYKNDAGEYDPNKINFAGSKPSAPVKTQVSSPSTAARAVSKGRGVIDTSNINPVTLLPKR